jgi:2-polyprenyl-6-methoxyphenol hydroxylase-like FAD-dependent oxidoreductase
MATVVIIGAGPAGAALALTLVQRGINVQLVEASREFRRVFRGEALMPSGLDALEQLGLSAILENLPQQPLDAWEVWIEGRSLFRVAEPLEPGGKPCTLVAQAPLITALTDAAAAYPSFELIQGAPVQELLWAEQRVCGVKLGDGRSLSADLVIGTDGRNSIARQKAGIAIQTLSKPFDVLWFKLADRPEFPSENTFYSIVQGRNAFGLFRSSEGNLQLGWSLHNDDDFDWKNADWLHLLATASPPWFADYLQVQGATLERPMLLSVVVGRAERWWVPGLLLLGDAVHPMSPVRAQGINMALRDGIVAANHLVPLLRRDWVNQADLDRALPKIQAEREPEIIRIQALQAAETAQAELLRDHEIVRSLVSQFAPLIRLPIRKSWLIRQRKLRQGIAQVRLTV